MRFIVSSIYCYGAALFVNEHKPLYFAASNNYQVNVKQLFKPIKKGHTSIKMCSLCTTPFKEAFDLVYV